MKQFILCISLFTVSVLTGQTTIDTLAFQDFEVTPAAPVWNFTGPVVYNSGLSGPGAEPANSPLGIGGSRAWETTSNSGGLILNFANTTIPVGYDSIRVRFNLAAMNLLGTGGGPDDLDYVLVAYSTDGGANYVNRIRVRGAIANNSTWPYSATGVARNYYLPASEQVFQPTTSGPQTTFGYSTVEIVFPGTVAQIAMRITGRSSSSTDTWMIDNLVMTGEYACSNSTFTMSAAACDQYITPSGNVITVSGTYLDTIPNASGCDSIITLNLNISPSMSSSTTATACGSYTLPGGSVVTASGVYMDTLLNMAGCDSVVTTNLTITNPSTASVSAQTCNASYALPSGTLVTSSGTYMDTIPNAAGCDSVITLTLTINSPSSASMSAQSCSGFYTLPSGTVVTSSGTYQDTIPNAAGCDSVMTWNLTVGSVNLSINVNDPYISSNAANATFQWFDCTTGNPVPGANDSLFLAPVNGTYAAVVTQGSCTDTTACITITSVGLQTTNRAELKVTPNPFTDKIFVSNCNENSVIVIMNVNGQVVATERTNGTQSEIDLSGQPAGFYFVEVQDADQVTRFEIIKQ